MGDVVDHEGDGAGRLGGAGELSQGLAVGRGVGEQDVVADGAAAVVVVGGQPQGLGQCEGHDALIAGQVEDGAQQVTAAHGLAGHANGASVGSVGQVGGV